METIYDTQLNILLLSIKRDVNNKLDAASAYFDFKTNDLIKKYGGSNKSKTHDVITEDAIISRMLKIRGYDKNGNIFTKGFVCVVVNDDNIQIKHDIKGSKWSIIDKSIITGLAISLNYFERI